MHKLVILIQAPQGDETFELGWPEFLRHAEQMPGLLKETTSRVRIMVYGDQDYSLIHELYFHTFPALEFALDSESGKLAGETLQRITEGRFALLFADHHEDTIMNLRRARAEAEKE